MRYLLLNLYIICNSVEQLSAECRMSFVSSSATVKKVPKFYSNSIGDYFYSVNGNDENCCKDSIILDNLDQDTMTGI